MYAFWPWILTGFAEKISNFTSGTSANWRVLDPFLPDLICTIPDHFSELSNLPYIQAFRKVENTYGIFKRPIWKVYEVGSPDGAFPDSFRQVSDGCH